MEFRIRPMTAQDAQAIAEWHYDGSYAFYDMDQDADDLAELLTPANWPERYQAVVDEQGALVGFFCFQPEPDGNAVEIGLGLRPNLTGHGLGRPFLEAGLRHAERTYHPTCITLAVAAFNAGAIRLYEQAGFRTVRRFQQATNGGCHAFLAMTRTTPL
jgi:ribosomal-protein-alanine N-acetyltransferase